MDIEWSHAAAFFVTGLLVGIVGLLCFQHQPPEDE